MKRLFNILVSAVAVFSLFSCEAELDPIVVYPDVKLSNTGMQTVNTITIYDTDEYKLSLARTEGLSKAAEFDLVINETLLNEYNETNGFNLKLMPESLYSLEHTKIAFDPADKDTVVMLNLKPAATLANAGSVAAAEEYAIPIELVPTAGSTINSKADALQVMVKFAYEEPIVTINGSANAQKLTFISGANVTRKLEVTGSVNFNTLDVNKISFEPSQAAVDTYNAEHGTSHELLAKEYYTISKGVYDAETNGLTFDLAINASKADPSKTYLLPVVAKCDAYTLRQEVLYYVVVDLQEVIMTIANTDRYVSAVKNNYQIPVEVSINGAVGQDMPIEFIYDESLIAGYNSKKGKTYKTFDASRITCAPANIAGDATKTTATITVNMKDIAFDNGDEFVLPFRLDKSKLMEGTKMASDDVVYVRLKRTLYGTWGNANLNDANKYTQKLNSVDNNKHVWSNNNYMCGITTPTKATQAGMYEVFGVQYPYMNAYYVWGRGYQWRVNWDEHFNGDPNKLVVKAWCCVTTGMTLEDQVTNSLALDNGCYFDLEDGLVYLNFQYYWSNDDKAKDARQNIKCYLAGGITPDEF